MLASMLQAKGQMAQRSLSLDSMMQSPALLPAAAVWTGSCHARAAGPPTLTAPHHRRRSACG
jgi:hypothetical protein